MRSRFYVRGTLAERFWHKVDRRGPDECWPWLAFKQKAGYGTMRAPKGMSYLAHRIAWQLEHGDIPADLDVCHHCDNPSCVNPAHLFLGTHQDNMRDRERKGRGRRVGTPVKLNEVIVREILDEFGDGRSSRRIAAKFGIAPSTAKHIRSGKLWRHVGRVA